MSTPATASSDSGFEECHVYTYCNENVGSCELSCTTALTALSEFAACVNPTDCICPYSCFGDARRGGRFCETPCTTDLDCADAGEACETDAGACQRPYDCYGADAGVGHFGLCVNPADCACPDNCVADPALTPENATAPVKLCERCDAGGCESVSGKCQAPAVPGAFQSSDVFPCGSDDDCTCPNRCTSSAVATVLMCEQECKASSDCNDPGQFCVNGQCVENTCPTPLACDLANGQDPVSDGGIGTCFPSPPLQEMVCHSGGTADGGCDPFANRSDTAGLCQPGLACAADSDGGFRCVASCAEPPRDCLNNDACIPSLGICLPVNDAGTCFIGGTPVEFQACYPSYYPTYGCGCAHDCGQQRVRAALHAGLGLYRPDRDLLRDDRAQLLPAPERGLIEDGEPHARSDAGSRCEKLCGLGCRPGQSRGLRHPTTGAPPARAPGRRRLRSADRNQRSREPARAAPARTGASTTGRAASTGGCRGGCRLRRTRGHRRGRDLYIFDVDCECLDAVRGIALPDRLRARLGLPGRA